MNVIYNTIKIINSDKWYGISENIERAKGKYKLGFKIEKIKRYVFLFFKK